MQINATTAATPVTPVDTRTAYRQQGVTGQQDTKSQDAAAEQAKADAEKKVFTPAPPLRPNIQDYVDINRTLIALRRI